MNFEIRKMVEKDRDEVLSMMEEFYSSEAVYTNGSREIFETDFNNCVCGSVYLEGYVFICRGVVCGYAMLAKSFSTEFGKPCIWFEDLYLKVLYRGYGIIPKFIKYVENLYPESILRLEAEKENFHAMHVYEKCGFEQLPYVEMKKEL